MQRVTNITLVAVACQSSTIEGKPSSKKAGSLTLREKSCSKGTAKCLSKGSESGVILASGEWSLETGEGTMLMLAPKELEFSCGTATIKVKGAALGLLYELGSESKEHEGEYAASEGLQEIGEYENSNEVELPAQLLASVNGATFEDIGLDTELLVFKTTAAASVQGSSPFAVISPLGNRMMRPSSNIQWRVINTAGAAQTPNQIRYTESPIMAGNKPFDLNEANRLGCQNFPISFGRNSSCNVELTYLRSETGASAQLRVTNNMNANFAASIVVGQ
jgi:hypothetical protein